MIKSEGNLESAVVDTVANTVSLFFFLNPFLRKYVIISLSTSNSILTCGGVYLVYQDTKTVPRDGSGLKFQCHQPLDS